MNIGEEGGQRADTQQSFQIYYTSFLCVAGVKWFELVYGRREEAYRRGRPGEGECQRKGGSASVIG